MGKMLYQQGTQRIEIIVRKESTGQDGAKENDTDKVSGTGTENETTKSGGLTTRQKRIIKSNTLHVISAVKSTAFAINDYLISGLAQVNGDQALQDQVARDTEIIKDTTGFAYSVSMGIIHGSWAGAWGMAIGGLTAALTSGTSLATKYMGREREFNFKIFKENNAIEYQRARAGINLTTGRLR